MGRQFGCANGYILWITIATNNRKLGCCDKHCQHWEKLLRWTASMYYRMCIFGTIYWKCFIWSQIKVATDDWFRFLLRGTFIINSNKHISSPECMVWGVIAHGNRTNLFLAQEISAKRLSEDKWNLPSDSSFNGDEHLQRLFEHVNACFMVKVDYKIDYTRQSLRDIQVLA